MKNNKKHYAARRIENGNLRNVAGQPQTAFELINKYGTYEIQPTNDSDNEFPEIAQGLPKSIKTASGKDVIEKS